MQLTLFLFLVSLMVAAFAQQTMSIFNYTEVASCARSCKVLTAAEAACIPLGALFPHRAASVDCFCRTGSLKSLHTNGYICNNVCSDDESFAIYESYERLCHAQPCLHPSASHCLSSSTSAPTPSRISISSSAVDTPTAAPSLSPPSGAPTLIQTLTSSSVAIEPTAVPSPPPTNDQGKKKEHETWIHSHCKYLIIAGVLAAFTVMALIFLAFLYWRRRRNAQAKRLDRENGLIPLQLLCNSHSTRRLSRPRTPRNVSISDSIANLPSTAPASPLAATHSPHSFGDTLRFYAEDIRERDEAYARGAALTRSPASKLPKNIGWRDMD